MIKGQQPLQQAYQDETVARDYVATRFVSPLGAVLHQRQVALVRRVIAEEHSRSAIEIAPGPARVTVDVVDALERVTLVDSSKQMLDEAAQRLAARGLRDKATLVQGDAFNLGLPAQFDLAYSFRLIRHFEREDRLRLYAEIRKTLVDRGMLVFDAVNRVVSEPLRAENPGEYKHYDALLSPEEIAAEVEAGGFELIRLEGVQHRYSMMMTCQRNFATRAPGLALGVMKMLDRCGGQPLEWVVVCRRK
jgi:SAM-dependent methyltransferase